MNLQEFDKLCIIIISLANRNSNVLIRYLKSFVPLSVDLMLIMVFGSVH